MQAYIKDGNKLIINSMILEDEKEAFQDFIELVETGTVSTTVLYDIEGEKSGLQIEVEEEE